MLGDVDGTRIVTIVAQCFLYTTNTYPLSLVAPIIGQFLTHPHPRHSLHLLTYASFSNEIVREMF